MLILNITVLMGFVSILLGSVCIYLASPNQRWLIHALPKWRARRFGTVLLATGLLAFIKSMQLVAASFMFVTSLMLMFVLLPYIGSIISAQRGR